MQYELCVRVQYELCVQVITYHPGTVRIMCVCVWKRITLVQYELCVRVITCHPGAVWTRTTRTPAFWGYPPPPHDYLYHWVTLHSKSKEDKFKAITLKNSPKFEIFEYGHYTRHTFWSCLIRCANMKWFRWVFLKIQSRHDSVHRRTDGQTDKVIPVYPPFNFVEAGSIIMCASDNLSSWYSMNYVRKW